MFLSLTRQVGQWPVRPPQTHSCWVYLSESLNTGKEVGPSTLKPKHSYLIVKQILG